jgi:hypothetical protein
VVIFTEMRGDDNNRLTVTINQAYKVRSLSSSQDRIFLNKRTEGSERRVSRSDRDVIRTQCLAWIVNEQLQSVGSRNLAYSRLMCHQKVNRH